MNWVWLAEEATRQWNAGNAAGVRAFYQTYRDDMPLEMRAEFADLLANEPRSAKRGRPRKPPKATPFTVTVDYFKVPEDVTVSEYVTDLGTMAREAQAQELEAKLRQAHAAGDKETLRAYGLHNTTNKAFAGRAREVAQRQFGVWLKSQAD